MAGRKSRYQLVLSVLLLPVGGGEDDIDTSSLEMTLLSLQYFALVTENTDITAITIGFNSFYHQISRDGEAGKYLLLHRK